MKRFQYSLERVLRVKRIREKIKQRELAVTLRQLQHEKNKLIEIKSDESKAWHYLQESQESQINSGIVSIIQGTLEGKRKKKLLQTEQVSRAEKAVSAARNDVLHATREKKIFEKLREYKLKEYEQQAISEEQKILDEVAINLSVSRSESNE